ncbi:alpha/beta-hydrolase [Lophium mytilinum]|uniref:Alpha/beta-hydrolase n=1 Tax=Lophium mytilinum TaxID=390894 RepID=A0A6A6QF66_9PEZI|nr:alpha/beta-hydrolase [Lophium mytilinum]
MSKPVFVLLHGAWHGPKCWDRLIVELEKAGYSASAPALPSSGSTPPVPDLKADIDIIRSMISKLAQERDIVVVMHSFSGLAGGTALEGLDKAACFSKGLKGGVVRLVYLAAFLAQEGSRLFPPGAEENMKSYIDMWRLTASYAKGMFYQDLDDHEVAELAKDLQTQSLGSFQSATTYAAWRYIPTTYVECTRDRPATLIGQRRLLETAKESGTHKIDRIIKVDSGHFPFISKPEWTAQVLIEEAGREVRVIAQR